MPLINQHILVKIEVDSLDKRHYRNINLFAKKYFLQKEKNLILQNIEQLINNKNIYQKIQEKIIKKKLSIRIGKTNLNNYDKQ